MTTVDVLRPALYFALQSLFRHVKVLRHGEPFAAVKTADTFYAQHGFTLDISAWGETYVVCCPFCNDTRNRLYVCHAWGLPESFGRQSWRFVKCFNDDCLKEPGNRRSLAHMVFEQAMFSYGKSDVVLQASPGAPKRTSGPVSYPGVCYPLSQLTGPHPARQYVISRGHDPDELWRLYGVAWCMDACSQALALASGRLIIPLRAASGDMVSWQARYMGETDWKLTPKYYNCPDAPRSGLLYALDRASSAPVLVVVEGVTDVWRYGDGAVAICGKEVSCEQATLLIKHARDRPIAILLDPEAWEESGKAFSRLALAGAKFLFRIKLRAGPDPGSLPRPLLRAIVKQALLANYPEFA
ncbi:MAG: hypothetical protein E6G97_18595 [Alphaproteobacteria bacterium]|nr:MAG: hypothetical protein E6G97_18595 [Alphaproteobacteria bacterium]